MKIWCFDMVFSWLKNWYVKRIVRKASLEWYEKTKDWSVEEWKDYQAKRFDEMKKNPWTSKVYPDLREVSYEDLLNYPMTVDYPEYPDGFPALIVIYTTGTTRKKTVMFTKEDALFNAKVIGALVHEMVGFDKAENVLSIAGERNYVSEMAAKSIGLFVKKNVMLYADEFVDKLDYIVKRGPYDAIYAAQVVIMSLLEKIKTKFLKDGAIILHTGDIMYESFVNFVNETVKKQGTNKVYLIDAYGASESPLLGVSHDSFNGILDLRPVLATSIFILEKENGERVNLLDADVGERGKLLITPMYTLTIPNYKIGDIIEITGRTKKGLPLYKVLGRDLYKVTFKHPKIGVVEGYSGAMFKIFAIPFNTYAFDKLMGRLKTRYLAFIEKEATKATIKLYVEKDIDKDFLIQQLKADVHLLPLYEGIVMGNLDIEIYKENLSFLEIFNENWKGGHLKVPRVITDIKFIERPAQVP